MPNFWKSGTGRGKDDTSGDEYSDTPDADSNAEDGGDTDYDSLSDYLNEDDIPDYKLQENNHSKREQARRDTFLRYDFLL